MQRDKDRGVDRVGAQRPRDEVSVHSRCGHRPRHRVRRGEFCHRRIRHAGQHDSITISAKQLRQPSADAQRHVLLQHLATTNGSDHAWIHPAVPGIDEHCLPRIRSAWAETHARARRQTAQRDLDRWKPGAVSRLRGSQGTQDNRDGKGAGRRQRKDERCA